jgi:hypothetical protein
MDNVIENHSLLLNHVSVMWPAINKNHLMRDNDYEIANSPRYGRAIIKRVIQLNRQEYATISTSLLNDRPELWSQIGGTDPSDCYKSTSAVLVIPHEGVGQYDEGWFMPFLVNTEGFDYARYVGRAIPKFGNFNFRDFMADNYKVDA